MKIYEGQWQLVHTGEEGSIPDRISYHKLFKPHKIICQMGELKHCANLSDAVRFQILGEMVVIPIVGVYNAA